MTKLWPLSFLILFVFSMMSSTLAFAHGEDKPGPNGGSIRMPGSFHTELVQVSDQKFRVFLLDLNWQNPSSQDSSVEAIVHTKKGAQPASCKIVSNYYECVTPKGTSLKTAQTIVLKSKRENVVGGLATYELPLKRFSHR